MTARKTIAVAELVSAANHALAAPDSNQAIIGPDFRMGVIGMVETALFATDNYHGYKYLPSEWDEQAGALREGYDPTRREYA